MKRGLIFTVGNSLMGDDAAGPLLAEKIRQAPLPEWDVLDGGSAPENYLHRVREMAPRQVLIVDSAEMGLPPGEIRSIDAGVIQDPFFVTTHTLPLTYLILAMQEITPEVALVGIQPELMAFGWPVSAQVRQAVEEVYTRLSQGDPGWEKWEDSYFAHPPCIPIAAKAPGRKRRGRNRFKGAAGQRLMAPQNPIQPAEGGKS